MRETNDEWMTYVDHEVRAACESKGWAHQLRRKWSVRAKPVSESLVEDYEWKIIPDVSGEQPEAAPDSFDQGTYYIVSFEKTRGKFVLQHDTGHCGVAGPNWSISTFSEIDAAPGPPEVLSHESQGPPGSPPPKGWLRDHLVYLLDRFEPNHFSVT